MKPYNLNDKQIQFCNEYVKDLNATRAYLEVYNPKNEDSCRSSSSRLLNNDNVKKYLKDLMKEAIEKEEKEKEENKQSAIADVNEILSFLTSVMRNEETEEQILLKNDEVLRLDKSISMKDKLKSVEMLARYYKLFTDVQEVNIEPVYFIEGEIQE